MGEAAGPPVRHQGKAEESVVEEEKKSDPIDNFKEEMEREYKKINESLQSAEQFSLMFSKRTRELTSNIYRIREVRELEKEKGKIEESLANDDESSADDGFEQKIKSWPREMVEKQLKHYRVHSPALLQFASIPLQILVIFFCGVSQEGELTLWCAAGRLQLGAKESGGDGGGEEQGGGGAHVGQARARTETTGSGDTTKRQGAARAIRGPACRGIASTRSFTSPPPSAR
jgi:hypothetical protein